MPYHLLMGDKNNFAVELYVPDEQESHHLFGVIRLWLQGKYIGAFEDMNILSVTLHALEVLTNNRRKIFADGFQVLPKDNMVVPQIS